MDIETTTAGKLKLLSLILGGLTVALTSTSLCRHNFVDNSQKVYWSLTCDGGSYSKEQYFLAISCIALILSVLLIFATALNIPKRFSNWSMIDMGCHGLMAILLLVGWIVFVISVDYTAKKWAYDEVKKTKGYKGYMAKRAFALIFQLINIVVYFLTTFFVFKNRNTRANLNY